MRKQHTPGPWMIKHDQCIGADVPDPNDPEFIRGVIVATMQGMMSNEQTAANADLIVAAPDLLAACEEADRLLGHLMASVDWGKTFGVDFQLLNQVLIALPKSIRKARGEA